MSRRATVGMLATGAVLTGVLTLMQGLPVLRWVYDSRSLVVFLVLSAGPVLLWLGTWQLVQSWLARHPSRTRARGGIPATLSRVAWMVLTGAVVCTLTAAGFATSVVLANQDSSCTSWCGAFSTIAATASTAVACLAIAVGFTLLAASTAAQAVTARQLHR